MLPLLRSFYTTQIQKYLNAFSQLSSISSFIIFAFCLFQPVVHRKNGQIHSPVAEGLAQTGMVFYEVEQIELRNLECF